MNRCVVLSCLTGLLSAVGPLAFAAQVGGRFFPYETHQQVLDNGLRVILVPMSSDGLVAYWSIVRTGSRDEVEPGRTGFAHFFEHMMFRGTEKYPQDLYNDRMTAMGADANAYTTDDLTAYHVGITAADLEAVVEMESDRFRNLSYAKAAFETEAGAVYGEYRKSRTRPAFALYEALGRTAFEKHTYGHTTMGFEQDIKDMPTLFDYSRSFFSRYYRPDNVVLLIVGDIEVEPTLALVRQHYSGWQAGYVAPAVEAEPAQTQERKVDVQYDGQTLPWLVVAYKSDRFDPQDKRGVALMLLAQLAFGETSEIHRKLVLDEQIVEFIDADLEMNRDPGLLEIRSRIKDAAQVERVLAEIDAVIERYVREPPDPQRLADLKSRLRYDFLMRLDTPDQVAGRLARHIALTGGIDSVDQLHATYETITPGEVRDAARHYLVRERRTVATLRGK